MYRLFENHKKRTVTELSDCLWDFHTASGTNTCVQKVFVPGCWETLPGLGNFRGQAVYSRKFTAGGNVRLEFKGVSHTAEIYVDGRKLREHYGAYTPFEVLLKNLEPGEHTLEVAVSNRFDEASALHIPNDYMTYGGINRPVIMEQIGSAYIKWAHFCPVKQENRWRLKTEVCVFGMEDVAGLSAELHMNGQRFCLKGTAVRGGEEVIYSDTFCMDGGLEEWSMENPCLYKAEVHLYSGEELIDDWIDRVGFREVRVQGNRILLNEKPVRIKGVCRHEEFAGFGCALSAAAIQKDLQMIQDLGCNSIRTTHYPNDEIFLDLCDELGILVWEENHARGLVEEDMRNPNFDWQCEQCNVEMVQNHYNHPSIYIWGILNECASETEYGRACYEKQLCQIRALDGSRPVTFATCRFKHKPDGSDLQLTDICMDLPDVVSYNIYPKWYFDTEVGSFLKALHACVDATPGKGKPMLISEIGAGGEYGFHSAEHLKWSEEYQRDALEEQLRAVLGDAQCCGVYIWQYCDVRVSKEWFARRPRSHNNKGIVDEYRRPKLAYESVKKIFQSYENYFV